MLPLLFLCHFCPGVLFQPCNPSHLHKVLSFVQYTKIIPPSTLIGVPVERRLEKCGSFFAHCRSQNACVGVSAFLLKPKMVLLGPLGTLPADNTLSIVKQVSSKEPISSVATEES